MTQHSGRTQAIATPPRGTGRGRSARSVLLLAAGLLILLSSPARALPPDPCDDGELFAEHFHKRGDLSRREPGSAHEHFHAHAFSAGKPHQHFYTHTHWHTHQLDDGTVIHHSHPHSHTYWHYGDDETDEERATRVPEDRERAAPTEEQQVPTAGHVFMLGGVGAAALVKNVQNMMQAINLLGAAEGFRLLKTAGIDLAVFQEVVRTTGAQSVVGDNYLHQWGLRPVPWVYSLEIEYALDMAREHGVPLPLAEASLPHIPRGPAAPDS